MNHLSSSFITEKGNKINYQTWEKGYDSYKWFALVLGNPFLPIEKNERFINLLMEKRFKIFVPENVRFKTLPEYVGFIDEFIKQIFKGKEDLAVVSFAFSTNCLPFLYYLLHGSREFPITLFASPILDYSIFPVKRFSFCRKETGISVKYDAMSSSSPELEKIKSSVQRKNTLSNQFVREAQKFYKNLIESPRDNLEKLNLGFFAGEDDSLINKGSLEKVENSLKKALIQINYYPRLKHLLFNDKHWKNVYADIGAFIDSHERTLFL
jgi:hypothetical protein